MILLDESADTGDLGNSGYAFNSELEPVVLEGTELGEVVCARFIDHRIRKSPSEPGRIWTQNRIYIRRDLVLYGLQVFEDPAAGPVDVRPFLEDDVNERTAKVREAPDCLDLGGCEKRRRNGVCDLILDQVGTSPLPFAIDNNLGIAQVGDCVQRDMLERPKAPGDCGKHNQENDKPVSDA